MKVRIKKINKNAVVPQYAQDGDAGLDLVAVSKTIDEYRNVTYGTGLAFEIPKGYVGLVFPRSSNSKTNLYLTNSVGVIDSGYRGEVMLKYKSSQNDIAIDGYGNGHAVQLFKNDYSAGERVGQIIILPYPQIEFEEVDELSSTERGDGGYGSTGK